MPKFPLFSLLAALAVISSFSMAAMAEDEVKTETSISSHTMAHDAATVTKDGHTTTLSKDGAASNSVKLHGVAPDADITVDDEE